MASTEIANVRVSVNGTEAEDHLKELYDRAKKFKKELEAAFKTKDPTQIKKAENAFRKVTKEVKKYENQLWNADKVLKNLGGSSLKDLRKAQKQLNRELSSGAIKRNTKAWEQHTAKLRLVDAELGKVRREMKMTQSLGSRLNNSFNKYSMSIMAFGAAIYGSIMKMRQAVDASNEFGSSVANLSALTGMAGKDLAFLKNSALEFSGSITDTGIRVTASAQDIVDAYTQMGSKRPELLKDRDALVAVTQQALILSQAAKMDLVPATNSLAVSMNQFNAEASEASRYINVIAAGSKIGAGNVEYQARTLEKAGTAIKLAGLSIEEGVAAVETLAPYFAMPAKAGTQLKNVMLNLQMGADQYNPKIVGMATSLDNLARAQLTVTELTKMFGKENVNAGQILIENRDKYKEYLKAVTDTNIATEQAVINTSTNKAKLESARATLAKMVIELGDKLAPALTFSTSSFGYMVRAMTISIKFFKDYGAIVISVAAVIVAYTVVMQAAVIVDKIKTFWTKKLIVQTKALYKAVMKNPYAAIAALVMAVVAALILYAKRTTAAQDAQKALNDVRSDAKRAIADEKVELESLLRIAKDENKSKATRQEAILKLNSLSPEYLGNITLEKINTAKATIAVNQHIKALERQARTQAAREKLVEIEKQLIDIETGKAKAKIKWYQTVGNAVKSFGNVTAFANMQTDTFISNTDEATKSLLAQKEALLSMADGENMGSGKLEHGGKVKDEDLLDPLAKWEDMSALLDESLKQKLNSIKDDYLNGIIATKQEYNTEVLANEIAALELEKVMLDNYRDRGLVTEEDYANKSLDIETKLLDKRLTLFDAELAAKKKLNDDKAKADKKAESDAEKARKKVEDRQKEQYRQQVQMMNRFQDSLADSLSTYIQGNEDAGTAAAKAMIILALDMLKMQLQMAMAQSTMWSLAQPDSIATFGAAGFARAALMGALIEGVFAGVKGVLMSSFDKKEEVQTGSTRQYYSGRYPVIGEDDNRLYNAQYLGSVKTGIVRSPSLISERGDEMIIDGATTKNLVFNYPQIIKGIKNLSNGSDPQFNTDYRKIQGVAESNSMNSDSMLVDVMLKLVNLLETPLTVEKIDFPMHELKKAETQYNQLEELAKKS